MGRDLFIINHRTAPEVSQRFKVGGMVGALSSIPLPQGQEDKRGQEFAHGEVVSSFQGHWGTVISVREIA